MGVGFGQSRIADLAFQVFKTALHPDWFATRQFRRIEQRDWEADLRVVEGGHAVVFRSGGVRLTEVLAGPDTVLPERGRLFHSTLRHERSALLRPGGTIEYHSCIEVERLDLEVFRHLSDEITLDTAGSRLFHCFRSANRLAPQPISHIRIEAQVRHLTIHAFHTFPDERAIVRTQSLFELKAPVLK
jgi:Protein of unknown function DUF2617